MANVSTGDDRYLWSLKSTTKARQRKASLISHANGNHNIWLRLSTLNVTAESDRACEVCRRHADLSPRAEAGDCRYLHSGSRQSLQSMIGFD